MAKKFVPLLHFVCGKKIMIRNMMSAFAGDRMVELRKIDFLLYSQKRNSSSLSLVVLIDIFIGNMETFF